MRITHLRCILAGRTLKNWLELWNFEMQLCNFDQRSTFLGLFQNTCFLSHQKHFLSFLIEIVRKWYWHYWIAKDLSFSVIPISISNDFYLTKYERFSNILLSVTFVGRFLKKCLELWNSWTLKLALRDVLQKMRQNLLSLQQLR